MKLCLVFASILLASCAAHVVDEEAAASELVESQIRHVENMGVIPTLNPN
jgi:hypothetical protein